MLVVLIIIVLIFILYYLVGPTEEEGKPIRSCEDVCRATLERIFGREFPNTRPSFLINPRTGRRLELDCYNKGLNLALEYNGKQHYVYPNYWHRSEGQFKQQQYRDKQKERICREKGITLIKVPYTVGRRNIPSFIVKKLRELDLVK